MMTGFVALDEVWPRVRQVVAGQATALRSAGISELWFVRDLTGRVRVLVAESSTVAEGADHVRALTRELYDRLGAHAYDPADAVLSVDSVDLRPLKVSALREEVGGISLFLVDRLVTMHDWTTRPVAPAAAADAPARFTLFSIQGGVGRSTTAMVLALHLARQGERVLVVDLDLESPGLSGLLLAPEESPTRGMVDWFVEDMVGQGAEIVRDMIGRPRWVQDLRGDILVVPAYGHPPGEYLAKLGRVYLDGPRANGEQGPERWTARLARLLRSLENQARPTVVLLDARCGLHDLGATAVMDIPAQVLLFGTDAHMSWEAYRILFEHWNRHQVVLGIRQRLSAVAALVPPTLDRDRYLSSFREHAWDLFREYLYDEVPADAGADADLFSFDLADPNGPHNPMPIYWNDGVAGGSPLRDIEGPAVSGAYSEFLVRVDPLLAALRGRQP